MNELTPANHLQPLSELEARKLTREIASTIDIAWEKIVEAYHRRVWIPLGYGSWDSYCRAELGSTRLRLPSEEREERVRSLRSEGLSIRAITSATGVSRNTARKDIRQVGQSDPPEHSGDPNQDAHHDRDDGEPIDAEIVDEVAHETPEPPAGDWTTPGRLIPDRPAPVVAPWPSVTGRDGKSYPRSTSRPAEPAGATQPAARRRSPLTDDARDVSDEIRQATDRLQRATEQLQKSVERIPPIIQDDRARANEGAITDGLRHPLMRVIDVATTALNTINTLKEYPHAESSHQEQ